MSRWKNKLDKHAIHGTVQHLKVMLEKIDRKTLDLEALDEAALTSALSERQRMMNLLNAIEDALKRANAEMVPASLVDRINSFLINSTKMHLEEYSVNRNLRILVRMNNELSEAVLNDIAQLQSLANRTNTTAQSRELEDAFASATEQIETTVNELEEMAENYSQAKVNLEESKKRYDERTKEILEEAENIREQILNIHGIIAGESEAAEYLKNANAEYRRAKFWQRILFTLIVAAIAWIGWLSGYVTSWGVDTAKSLFIDSQWFQIYKSITVTLLIVSGAGYAARQSGKHREAEEYNRNKALDIMAFNPFIANLDENEQRELRAAAIRMFFKLDNSITHKNREKRKSSNDEQMTRSEYGEWVNKKDLEKSLGKENT